MGEMPEDPYVAYREGVRDGKSQANRMNVDRLHAAQKRIVDFMSFCVRVAGTKNIPSVLRKQAEKLL